jgi:hypothetical protein
LVAVLVAVGFYGLDFGEAEVRWCRNRSRRRMGLVADRYVNLVRGTRCPLIFHINMDFEAFVQADCSLSVRPFSPVKSASV